MENIILVLLIIIGIAIFIIVNLLSKNEKLEDNIDIVVEENNKVWEYIVVFQKQIKDTVDRMHIIDRNGAFKADDEVGYIFKRLTSALDQLNEFIDGESKK